MIAQDYFLEAFSRLLFKETHLELSHFGERKMWRLEFRKMKWLQFARMRNRRYSLGDIQRSEERPLDLD